MLKLLSLIGILLFKPIFTEATEVLHWDASSVQNVTDFYELIQKNEMLILMISSKQCVSCPNSQIGFQNFASVQTDAVQYAVVKLDYRNPLPTAEPFKTFAGAGYPRYFAIRSSKILGTNMEYRNLPEFKEEEAKFKALPENTDLTYGSKKFRGLWERLAAFNVKQVREKLLAGESYNELPYDLTVALEKNWPNP